MGDEPAEVAPVQLTASFVLLERAEPPPKPETPADGAEDPAAAEGETPPAIESITFALTVDDPVGAAETSEPLSVTIPQASEEEPNPAPTDWPEAVKWAHTLEISVDEANSEVDFLRGGFHVAVKNGNDDLVAADIDLSEFLVNSKAVSRRFEIPDLGLVAVTVTLDKVWLPEALALQLMPMAVTVRSVEALPKDPHSYSALATAFEPVHCEYQLFDSQPTVKTEALPHGKKLNFKDRHVFHAGRFASAADVQALLEAGFAIRVHDRNFVPPEPEADKSLPEAVDEAGADVEPEAGQEAPATTDGDADEETSEKVEVGPTHVHCGEARVTLGELLLNASNVKQRANVQMLVNRAKDIPATPVSAIPRYIEATTTINVEVSLGFPATALREGPADTTTRSFHGEFARSFYVFKYNDHDFCKALLKGISSINSAAVGLPSSHKLDVCAIKPEQPLLTGYQIADGSRRIFYVEGPRAVMDQLAVNVPRDRANSDSFKILRSENLGFDTRLFPHCTLRLPTYRLFETLSAIMLHPEFLKVIKTKQVPPACVDGVTRLWTVRRCDYLREVARMDLWPDVEAIDSVNTFFGDDVKYEDVYGEPKPAKAVTKSALEQMQEAEADDGAISTAVGWKDGYYSKPVAKWIKWRKLTERTTQLDVGNGGQNPYFDSMRCDRTMRPAHDFNAEAKAQIATVSDHNASLKPSKPDVSRLIPEDGQVYLYSTQSLNTAELQKEVLRQEVDKPENRNLFFTYSDDYMSLAMCRVNEAQIEQQEKMESQSRWKTKEGFLWPAPKDPREYNKHPKQLSEAAREDLRQPWVENILHPKPVSRDTSFDPASGKPQWDNITKEGQLFEKNPAFFNSVFAPAALGLTPEQAEALLKEERNREAEIWRSKLVVDSPNFHVYFRNTMRKKVHPLERLETFLKGPVDPKRKALTGKKSDPRTKGAIKQAPISMLAGEPYEDPRDFTLDLKKNEPKHNVVPEDFDRLSGLNTKTSLLPHNIHTRPTRGEGGEESRRRILGMGGTIESIRSEERTSVLFGAKISKPQKPPEVPLTLPPI